VVEEQVEQFLEEQVLQVQLIQEEVLVVEVGLLVLVVELELLADQV
jgi:hypothetical protein